MSSPASPAPWLEDPTILIQEPSAHAVILKDGEPIATYAILAPSDEAACTAFEWLALMDCGFDFSLLPQYSLRTVRLDGLISTISITCELSVTKFQISVRTDT